MIPARKWSVCSLGSLIAHDGIDFRGLIKELSNWQAGFWRIVTLKGLC